MEHLEQERPNRKMKDCFGVSFGWFMEDLIGDTRQLEQCYECPDYDMCYKMSQIRTLHKLRFDIQRAASSIGRSMGGSHSSYPFG